MPSTPTIPIISTPIPTSNLIEQAKLIKQVRKSDWKRRQVRWASHPHRIRMRSIES